MNCEDDFLDAFAKLRNSYLSVCLSVRMEQRLGLKLSTIFDGAEVENPWNFTSILHVSLCRDAKCSVGQYFCCVM
jgi:hypothetical protein